MKRNRTSSLASDSDDGKDNEGVAAMGVKYFAEERILGSRGYDVGVFWDYENVRIPRWCRTADAANAIRSAVIGYGRISERRLYYDSKKVSEQFTDRVNLDLSGFTLVDCPARGKKETLDKRMIVDILGFAWERTSRRIPTCVALITSDGDYSYTVAKLRDIGVCTVIIYGERTTTADVLLDACDHAMSWIFDVLKRPTIDETDAENESIVHINGVERDETLYSGDEAAQSTQLNLLSSSKSSTLKLQSGNGLSPLPLSRETSRSEASEGRHLIFLNCVVSIQMMQFSKLLSNAASDEERQELTWENCWALDAQVVQLFNSKRGIGEFEPKSYYKEIRKSAVVGQFIRIGRQDPNTGIIYDVTNGAPKDGVDLATLSPQQYLQLTTEGRAQLSGYVEDENEGPV